MTAINNVVRPKVRNSGSRRGFSPNEMQWKGGGDGGEERSVFHQDDADEGNNEAPDVLVVPRGIDHKHGWSEYHHNSLSSKLQSASSPGYPRLSFMVFGCFASYPQIISWYLSQHREKVKADIEAQCPDEVAESKAVSKEAERQFCLLSAKERWQFVFAREEKSTLDEASGSCKDRPFSELVTRR